MLRVASALLLVIVLAEGIAAYGIDRARGNHVTPYADIGQSLHNAVPGDAIIAGPVRWAWPLKSHSYIAMYNLALQWQIRNTRGFATDFSDLTNEYGVDYLLVSNSVGQMFARSSHALQTQFETFQRECTERVFSYDDDTYGLLEFYRIIPKTTCK